MRNEKRDPTKTLRAIKGLKPVLNEGSKVKVKRTKGRKSKPRLNFSDPV